MPVVTIKIPNGGGSVRVSKKGQYDTAYSLVDIASAPETDFEFPFWSYALFAASADSGFQFEKFCSDSNRDGKVTCGDKNRQMIEAEIELSHDELIAYFTAIPQPATPAFDIFKWIQDTFLWWMK